MATELYVGMMSGTSVDGIDSVLVEIESARELRTIATSFTPYPESLRSQINQLALNNADCFSNSDSPLHEDLAQHYAQAALKLLDEAGVEKAAVSAIANHGQTVRHEPDAEPPFSVQLGSGQTIAQLTGIPVITQFRQADMAAGGQGAPLMPAFHAAVLANNSGASTFVLNLGGIANLTRLAQPVVGYDIGPANCLMDGWIERHQGKRFDENGQWASSGKPNAEIVGLLMADPWLQRDYPKSTGTDYFNLDWVAARVANLTVFAPEDVQASLLAFTVECTALALQQLHADSGDMYVCGGGANNDALLQMLRRRLPDFTIAPTDSLGIPADWVEAAGFAWLGYCYQHSIASNLPSVIGAKEALVLGEMFQP